MSVDPTETSAQAATDQLADRLDRLNNLLDSLKDELDEIKTIVDQVQGDEPARKRKKSSSPKEKKPYVWTEARRKAFALCQEKLAEKNAKKRAEKHAAEDMDVEEHEPTPMDLEIPHETFPSIDIGVNRPLP